MRKTFGVVDNAPTLVLYPGEAGSAGDGTRAETACGCVPGEGASAGLGF